MDYRFEHVEEILEKKWCNKCKIDHLLHIDAMLYQNLGETSSKAERTEVKKKSKKIYLNIKKIDAEIGERLVSSMD
jgi:hypothetical protein